MNSSYLQWCHEAVNFDALFTCARILQQSQNLRCRHTIFNRVLRALLALTVLHRKRFFHANDCCHCWDVTKSFSWRFSKALSVKVQGVIARFLNSVICNLSARLKYLKLPMRQENSIGRICTGKQTIYLCCNEELRRPYIDR